MAWCLCEKEDGARLNLWSDSVAMLEATYALWRRSMARHPQSLDLQEMMLRHCREFERPTGTTSGAIAAADIRP